MISVILPTLKGREEFLRVVLQAYETHTEGTWEPIVVTGSPAWGEALNIGAEKARGEHLLFACDDMQPLAYWDRACIASLDRGELPAPTIEGPSGEVYLGPGLSPSGEPLCVLPFCSRFLFEERLGPMLNTHYFADNAFTDRVALLRLRIDYPPEFRFRHLMARVGQPDQQGQLARDIETYNAAVRFAGLRPSIPMPRL